jgi:hypothetical protein
MALCAALLWTLAPAARAAEPEAEAARLQVTDPYLELHTGPGRGYPVFHVVERQQWIHVELRHTDWLRVRTEAGVVGWVTRQQLQGSLDAAGQPRSWRDTLVDGGLRRVEAGGSWGRFKADPMLKLWLQVRLADTLSVELAGAQVQGAYSGTDFWHLSLVTEPWSDQRWSPFFSVGVGRFGNTPNTSLVDAVPAHARLGQASLGLRWRFSERYLLRLDGTLHTAFVSDQRSTEFRSLGLGLGFTF